MRPGFVQVPGLLLRDSRLTASAKLIWMVERWLAASGATGAASLASHSGFSRETVKEGRTRLAAAGWPLPAAGGAEAGAPHPADVALLPGALLTDREATPAARILYGVLQLTPGYCNGAGTCTYAKLADLMGASVNTVKPAFGELARRGWLRAEQGHRRAPLHFVLQNPGAAQAEARAAEAELRLTEARFRGEALTREYLSLIVASDDFMDNAAPGYLVNPLTGELLQFDRFYPPNVAFEYNGPQHDRPTRRFSAAKVAKQRTRDLIKRGICAERGIHLIVIHAEDLTLDGLVKKIGGLLPLRDLSGDERLVALLEFVSGRYRLEATRGRYVSED